MTLMVRRVVLLALGLLALCLAYTRASVISTVGETLASTPLWSHLGSLWVRAVHDFFHSLRSMITNAADPDSPWTYVLGAVGLYIAYRVYQLLCVPLNRVRLLGDLGYIADGKMGMKEVSSCVKRQRIVGDCPPVYPNGWFSVLESRDLKIGEARAVSCLGLHLAVFRGEDGQAYITDAYCPHMGASLGAGGLVRGKCIECPFHGWQFQGDDGKCVHIPYAEKKYIPPSAKIKSYLTLERNNFIYMWHHAEGVEPFWEPPEIEEIKTGEWRYGGRTEHYVNAHIEEVPENGADVAHLLHLHSPFMSSGVDLRFTRHRFWSFAQHIWSGTWAGHTEVTEKHIGTLSLEHHLQLFGIKFPLLDVQVQADQIGPGIVYLTFSSPIGRGAYLQSLTPVEPLMQRMVHQVYFHWAIPTIISKFFMLGEAIQVERDIMIWNNKRYTGKPLFVKSDEDALIARHRRWYSQFYSENSPRYTDLKQKDMDW